MRLRKLDLTRYGKFTDYSLDFGEAVAGTPDLHIVYGLNEAGKSTAFAAYLDFLFGIEERSRFNFLHPYSAMQIGACLDFNGTERKLVRTKQRTNSLLDEHGQPVNETLLGMPLAGLGRDAYRTMFSLDERSLEDGGNAIIQSKGDLGELLFSASAGLAGLSQTLDATAGEANLIHKKRGRNTHLAELKQTLVNLKAQRDEIDTFASIHSHLIATYKQAQSSYGEAMGDLGNSRTKHSELARIMRALPLAAEHARLTSQFAVFADLPRPPTDWASELPQLTKDQTRIQTQIDGVEKELARLQAEIDLIDVDEQLEPVADRILGLEDGRARFRTAENDLPRRRVALAEHEAALSIILASLEQTDNKTPEALLLPASLIGALRDLIETRSGLDATLQTATRELTRAKQLVDRAAEENAKFATTGGVLDQAATAPIETALTKLQSTDHQARLRVSERDRGQLARNYENLLSNLRPWTGDGTALHAIAPPEARQIESWRSEALLVEKRLRGHKERLRDLITQQRDAQARIEAIQAAAGLIDDAKAQQSREARTKAWDEHLAHLDITTAQVFEQKMRTDDDLNDARLARSRDLAELRQLTQTLAVHASAIVREEELLVEADAERLQLSTRIRKATPLAIEWPEDRSAEDWLSYLERWSSGRKATLVAWNALQQVDEDIAQARAEFGNEVAALVDAMRVAGVEGVETLSAAGLMQAAGALLSQAVSLRAERATAATNLLERQRELAERQQDFTDADKAAKLWDGNWRDALAKTWFETNAPTVAEVREILKALADLPATLRERDQMAQRIATMENDRNAFQAEVGHILKKLGEIFDPAQCVAEAEALTIRYDASQRAHQFHSIKMDEYARLLETRRGLEQELAVHEARKTALTTFFGVETLSDVSNKLEQVAEKQRFERRIVELSDQIVGELRSTTFGAAEELLAQVNVSQIETEAAELSARVDNLEERTKLLFADLTRAKDKVEQVGGDGAVARIELQRRTVLLEIEDLAQKYLRLRTGAMAAENALHLYRDRHRSSMMKRASEAFRRITRGEYSGLAAKPEKDKEILIGVPRQGGSKMSDAMSTGTQFQLYLALRLAGYQEFAQVRPSVPFIADDIMETFDEPRSEEVFRLLAEMAKIGQVIYLTHHRHLCEIAQKVVPTVRIHELGVDTSHSPRNAPERMKPSLVLG
ncbi:AAA family ATPase [Phyllobacterium endophyticum]|uniref:YhaN AAA domain-containing protein n=1 Tax=Phyllobacterium endophyticum TaxID=1149773 RepID=A0A2P7AS90_9HYPH|nr:AAA family ATPase [Phyllobacterium endophyticum]MBB3236825.1 uncharacterized protein YhaN [Phyllobacterium endophyticum]PSH57092.1 hypothetical protein CU100_17650 [Phyllobacterium endophyticum]TYR40370.1 AAA family ATPase [Phyllobacterium endophyticum]